MWKRSENIVHRLFSRQVTSGRPNRNIYRAREFYENVIPSHTVYEVDCPDQWWRRFTNDGQYLICFSKTYQDVLIYRPLWPAYWTTLDSPHELPSRFHKFESYFTLLHQIPLARTPNEVICKDFFLATENNLYGIFATSTAPDPTAAAAPGAVPGVPCIEKITFLVVRFADGALTGRTVFEDDYIHLAHNAGVFLHEDLLAVLSIRFQRIHILQIRDGGVFLDVRTVGDFCREDDELLLNSQSQAETHFQEDQRLQRKARGRIREDESNSKPQPRGMMKPWTSLIDRKRPRHRDDNNNNNNNNNTTTTHDFAGGNNSHEIDILYDGYFRGLFTGGDDAPIVTDVRTSGHGEHENGSNNNNRRIGIHSNGNGSTHGSHCRVHGRRLGAASPAATATAHENGSHEVLLSGHQYAAHENNSSGRRHGIPNVSSSGSLYSSSGSDIASHSYTSTADLGSSDATASHYEFSSHHRDEAGPSERWMTRPVPSMSVRGSGLGLGLDLGLGLGLRPNVEGGGEQTTVSNGASGGGRLEFHLGLQSGNPGNPNSGVSLGSLGGFGSARGGRGVTENATGVTTSGADAVLQSGSHILRGLKQRLLSFILQGIQNDDTTPACKAQRLKRFYYHFQHYVDLVMWKVQFLDRCHLLIKFGSVDGVVLRNSEASYQTAFLAIYNMETTEILGFHQNSSEELLQLVERYWDHFRVVPQNPLYMNFISSSANNSFAREQFRKEKDACISGKAGSYTQVIKRTLASLPHNSQSQSPSAYFDQYLFHYDEKLISSTDRHKPCVEHPIKFISRRRPNTLKFKINPGLELGSNDGHIKRVASFLFHPIFPFAISVQQSFMQTSVVNFHFRR